MDSMNPTTQPLDLRTLLLLAVEHEDVPRKTVLELIAHECNVTVERLTETISEAVVPQPRTITRHPKPAVTDTPVVREPKAHERNAYTRWTPERVNELVSRWNGGERPSKIAESMGCSTQTVYQKISKLRRERSDIKSRESKNPAFATMARAG